MAEQPHLPLAGQPDPSYLTTEALNREVTYLRTLLEAQADAARLMATTLRETDEKFENERDRRISEVKQESDRRLTEVATEREKALKIKEEADKEALRLDREIRQFKDDKASLRTDAAVAALEARLRPLDAYVAAQQGQERGVVRAKTNRDISFGQIVALITMAALVIGTLAAITHGFTK